MYGSLDYWESGLDMSISADRFESFLQYQARLRREFSWMEKAYRFHVLDANRHPDQVHADVARLVLPLYEKRPRPTATPSGPT